MLEQVPIMTSEEALSMFHELRQDTRDVPEMSLDEINATINAVRAERKMRCDITAR